MLSYLSLQVLTGSQLWFFVGSMGLEAILLLRLFYLKIPFRYKALTALLLVELTRSIILQFFLQYGKNSYSIFYVATQPLIWVVYVWVAYETYGFVLESYRGLSILSQRLMTGVLLLSACCAVWISAANADFKDLYPILAMVSTAGEAVSLTVFVFLMLLCAFLVWYPIPLRRNLVVYVLGFGFYFLTFALGEFLRSRGGHASNEDASLVLMSMESLCLVFWTLGLSFAGEKASVAVGNLLHAGDEKRLLAQLDHLNSILLQTKK